MIRIFFYIILIFNISVSLAQIATRCDVKNVGNVKLHGNSRVGIFGNLINEGDFSENSTNGASEVGFYNQNTGLSISGTQAPEFNNLIVKVPNYLNLHNTNVIVNGMLQFSEGRIVTPRDSNRVSLDLVNDATTIFEGDLTHVDGYSEYTGILNHTFPIGDDLRIRPISIENTIQETTTKAAYFFENPESQSTFITNFDSTKKEETIGTISPYEFWDLDGSISTKATLTWDRFSNISQLINDIDLTKLTIVGWSKSKQEWVNLGNATVSGSINNGQITSNSFIPNDFEILSFGSINSETPTDINNELFVFNAISDNNDNINSYLIIKNISKFPNNTLTIFNRWGVIVYETNGYDADTPSITPNPQKRFFGQSTGRATIKKDDLLPVGTYFYILKYQDNNQKKTKELAGYLYINR